MLRDITIGQYYPVDSKLHRLDPRTKILITFAFIATLFSLDSLTGYFVVAVFLGSLIKLSKVPLKFILRGLKPIMMIIIFTVTINMFFTKGTVLFSIWFIKITKEGIFQASFMGLRLVFLIIGSSLMTLTTSPIELTDGIEKLLGPFKKIGVPAHELAMMMTIALRFIPTLLEETDKIMKAQMARGADFDTGGLISKAKSMVPILVPLFISAFRRADELAVAMESRCYRGGENRTRMKTLSYNARDALAVAAFSVYLAVLLSYQKLISILWSYL